MFRFLLVVGFIGLASSQSMTQPAVKRFFKFCSAADLATATKNLNAAYNVTFCKNACTTFGNGKTFVATGTTAPASDPLSKPAAAITSCQSFCVHRASVKKYINYQFADLGAQYFSAAMAGTLKAMLWDTDKKDNNNFTKTIQDYIPTAMSKIAAAKQPILASKIQSQALAFNKTYPVDYKNVFSYVY